jgi:hypothetical protein
MRFINRRSLAAALGVIATVAACSDSTTSPGGGGPKAGTLAQHFDTLFAQAKALSATNINYLPRANLLSGLELAAAFGASPTNVTVTTSVGTEQWKGFVIEEVLNDTSSSPDSAIFVFVYRDSMAHTGVLSGFHSDGTPLASVLLTDDTIGVNDNSRSGSFTLVSVGGSCATPIAGLVNPLIATDESDTCASAVFNIALTLGFPSTAGVDAALTSISFPVTSFGGERFVVAASAGARVASASRLQAWLRPSH